MLTLSSPNKQPYEYNPTIDTILLSEFLDMLFTYYRDRTLDNGLVIDSTIAHKIADKDPKELYCHIEFFTDRPKIAQLYRIKEWKESAEKVFRDRRRSEFERRDKDYKMDCCSKIVEQLKQHPLAGMLELEQLKVIAHNIVYKDRKDIAEKFGITELVYKGEIKI